MLVALRRVLAVLLSLSVQWSALGGALVACADMELRTGGMTSVESMADMAGMHREDQQGRPDQEPQERGASSPTSCCAPEAPFTDGGSDAPSGSCALTATCLMPMMPARLDALRSVPRVTNARQTTDGLAPSALFTPPDAPPPRA